MIYMISNRATFTENGKRIFKNKGNERALPGFRIAECFLDKIEETVNYQILKGNAPKNANAMFSRLAQQLTNVEGKGGDVLLFIPGYGNTLDKNRSQIYKLFKTYVEPSESPIEHLLFLSWPGKRQPVLTYRKGQKDALETGKILAKVFEHYQAVLSNLFEAGNKLTN